MQSGHEKTLTALLPVLAGANMIYGSGMLELGITLSLAQLVVDSEFAMVYKNVINGVRVDDEALALDVIARVGARGNFLAEEHTFKHVRAGFAPKLIDRNMREVWQSKGAQSLSERGKAAAISILENHKPDPLPEGVAAKLSAIIADAEKDLGIKN